MDNEIFRKIPVEKLFSPQDRVIAAVSGGADSMALLHLLQRLQAKGCLSEVAALHVHHGLRGEEADRDEAAVRRYCDAHKVSYYPYFADVAAEAARTHSGLEAAGRKLRYEIYDTWVRQGWLVATGHTRSDTAETVLLHLTRGCGLSGLAGIPLRRDGIVRPLLMLSRTDTETYCFENALEYVTDSTNGDVTFARNRVRTQVLPQLRCINSQAEESIARMAELVRAEDAFLNAQAEEWLARAKDAVGRLSREVLRDAPPVLAMRVLRLAFDGYDVSQQHWQELYELLTQDGAVTLPHGRTVRAAGRFLWEDTALPADFFFSVHVNEPFTVAGETYVLRLFSRERFEYLQKIHNLLFHFSLSYDIIKSDLYVRQRHEGDAYHPVGRGGKSLKKLFNEAGLDAYTRAALPILCDADGILFVPGFGCDERARITEQTKQVLLLLPQEWAHIEA